MSVGLRQPSVRLLIITGFGLMVAIIIGFALMIPFVRKGKE